MLRTDGALGGVAAFGSSEAAVIGRFLFHGMAARVARGGCVFCGSGQEDRARAYLVCFVSSGVMLCFSFFVLIFSSRFF